MKKIAFIIFLLIGALSMIIMSYHYFQSNDTGILKGKEVANRLWYLIALRTHIIGGLIAITTGPTQFSIKLRKRFTSLHKNIGYIYIISVVLSSIAGLIVARFAMGGFITAIGFSILSILWFCSTLLAIIAIKKGDIKQHRKWMFYSYALTFSAITQRTLLLVPLITTISFIPIYQLSAWLPWIINLGIASLILNRRLAQTTTELF